MKKYIIKRIEKGSRYHNKYVNKSRGGYTDDPHSAFIFDNLEEAKYQCTETGEKPVLLKGQLAAYNKKK